jgi:Ca-activated chloride channel homolog
VTGRHRNTGPSLGILAGVIAVLLLAALAGWGGYRLLNKRSCANQVTVTLAAAPEITTALQTVAEQWTKAKGGGCTSIVVDPEEPAAVAATVAGQRGATLTGLGQPDGRLAVPDVWVPDSTTWLDRVRTVSPDLVPATTTSIATSPVVLAMPQPVAASMGWPKAPITWGTILQRMAAGSGLKVGIVEPGRDASGLSGLLALRSVAAASGPGAQEATVAALRTLAAGRSALREDLVAHFPRATDLPTLASSLAAAPLPEQTVLAYNANKPSVPLAAVYLDPAPAPLNYPYVVMPGAQPASAAAARDLFAMLPSLGFTDLIAKSWLRGPDSSAGFAPGPGSPSGPPAPVPATDPGLLQETLSTWSALTQPGRILAVVDVSGSMLLPVAAAPGFNREQVTVRAAQGGLQLFDDTWVVGLWIFSTDLVGHTPYQELVPLGPLSSQRAALNSGLAAVAPKRLGNTGLYETILAAYKNVQQGWDAGRVNSVLIMTDGQQDNPPNGMTLDQLVTELQKVINPHQPVEVIAIGIGTDVSKPELTRITQTTGGGVFIATDPTQIGAIFLQAIALRPGSGG